MKVLFTITGPWGIGTETVVDGITREFQNLGHRVKVVFPDLGLPSPDANKYYGNPELYHILQFPAEHQGVDFLTFPLIIPDPNPRNLRNAWTFKEMTDKEFQHYIDFLRLCLQRVIQDFQPDIIETEHVWLMGYVLNELGYTLQNSVFCPPGRRVLQWLHWKLWGADCLWSARISLRSKI